MSLKFHILCHLKRIRLISIQFNIQEIAVSWTATLGFINPAKSVAIDFNILKKVRDPEHIQPLQPKLDDIWAAAVINFIYYVTKDRQMDKGPPTSFQSRFSKCCTLWFNEWSRFPTEWKPAYILFICLNKCSCSYAGHQSPKAYGSKWLTPRLVLKRPKLANSFFLRC